MADQIIQCQASLIKVANRFRKDFGDIESLAASISEIGLLQPIGIDSGYRLVFGERRLRACLSLGWEKIPVRTVHLDSILQGELAENEFRKDFTPSERVAIGEAIELELGERHGGDRKGVATEDQEGKNSTLIEGKTRDIAAKAAGFGNGKTYEQAKRVANEAAPELVQAMDEGRASVSGALALLVLPKDQQASVAAGDKKSIQQASKAAKAPPKEQARASDLILSVITQVELIGRYVERSEVGVPSFAGQFLSDLIEADATIQARLSAILPVLQGLSDIASAVEA
ncbi:ParB/RepB/Spo0J family partition protein [Pseudomonas lactis]|jgi:ParB family chromosome partitioning protein|uniref:ParB N-terminal domain-containing protein n=1 Tax=Pseudomonas lactis TaxID=1615674 RepID=A0A7Y1QD97_9PSED|nr:ParB N-terminal domain-containing protein [Pseudomonas lactis]NNA77010.1 ParB N-terminal domain-containing protein [Pseudomonas lactis]NNA83069.1 ParB N-terminal domain-containing protein [Pseudomonas lactis]